MKPSHIVPLVVCCVVLVPSVASAYVDPGILASLYQLGYAALFGAATLFIFRPWAYLRSFFKGSKRQREGEAALGAEKRGS